MYSEFCIILHYTKRWFVQNKKKLWKPYKVYKEFFDRMSYLQDEIRDRYEGRVDPQANKWTAFRILQKNLEEFEFDAEEIQLLGAIISDVVNKHGGSKEEVFRALYKGYKM